MIDHAPPADLADHVLAALPIFPLPGAVLLPGGVMPLHIFEPRYREMTADVLAGARVLAIAQLRAGAPPDAAGRPAVTQVVGAGAIVASERLPDGRYHILVRGLARVRIDEELTQTLAYRTVRGHALADLAGAALGARHVQLLGLCDRIAEVVSEGGEELRELVRSVPTPGGCADLVAAAMVEEPALRQALLEELDPAIRLDIVASHVAGLLARLAPPSGGLKN